MHDALPCLAQSPPELWLAAHKTYIVTDTNTIVSLESLANSAHIREQDNTYINDIGEAGNIRVCRSHSRILVCHTHTRTKVSSAAHAHTQPETHTHTYIW